MTIQKKALISALWFAPILRANPTPKEKPHRPSHFFWDLTQLALPHTADHKSPRVLFFLLQSLSRPLESKEKKRQPAKPKVLDKQGKGEIPEERDMYHQQASHLPYPPAPAHHTAPYSTSVPMSMQQTWGQGGKGKGCGKGKGAGGFIRQQKDTIAVCVPPLLAPGKIGNLQPRICN